MSDEPLHVSLLVEQLRRAVPGGIGTYTRGLLKGLTSLTGLTSPSNGDDGRENEVFALTLLASRSRSVPDPLAEWGWPIEASPLPSLLYGRLAGSGLLAVGGTGHGGPRRRRLVHATSMLAPRTGTSVLTVTVHDLAWVRFPDAFPPRGRRWHEHALKRTVSRSSAIVVPSVETGAVLADAEPSAAERISVIPEGVDHLAPLDEAARTAAARVLKASGVGDRPYILSVSTLEPRKNLPRLLEAHRLLRDARPDAPVLLLVGPAGWGTALEHQEGVFFAGKVDDSSLTGLYAGAVAVAYVPLEEGFGLPAAEAMSLGVPVVASPGVPSAVGACIEADPFDCESIAYSLETATVDTDSRARSREAGLKRAATFTWRSAAEQHLALWRKTADAR